MSPQNLDLKTQKIFIKAEKLRKGKNFIEAISLFNQLLKDRPNLSPVLNNLGMCMEGISDFKEAEKFYLKCLQITPNELIPTNNLSKLYFSQKIYKKAIPLFQRSLKIKPDQKLIAEMMIESLYNLNLKEDTDYFGKQAYQRYPDSEFVKYYYGKNLLKIGQHIKGLKLINEVEGRIEFNNKNFIINN